MVNPHVFAAVWSWKRPVSSLQSAAAKEVLMLNIPGPLDEAQMRQEFRRLYREIGYDACTQVLYEMLVSARWLSEIMLEERKNG